MPEPILFSLSEPFRSVLLSMYAGDSQPGMDGEKHSIDPAIGISPAEGKWIYEMCRMIKPQATLEIGLACGFSTLYFLAALVENGSGRHTSIDPHQMKIPGGWAGPGVAAVSDFAPRLEAHGELTFHPRYPGRPPQQKRSESRSTARRR